MLRLILIWGAAELIRAIFPDMVAEEVMDIVATLMVWKDAMAGHASVPDVRL